MTPEYKFRVVGKASESAKSEGDNTPGRASAGAMAFEAFESLYDWSEDRTTLLDSEHDHHFRAFPQSNRSSDKGRDLV